MCSHFARVLFYIEAWTRINGKLICTQVKCMWLLPTYVNEVSYARARDINFKSAKKLKAGLDTQDVIAWRISAAVDVTTYRIPADLDTKAYRISAALDVKPCKISASLDAIHAEFLQHWTSRQAEFLHTWAIKPCRISAKGIKHTMGKNKRFHLSIFSVELYKMLLF